MFRYTVSNKVFMSFHLSIVLSWSHPRFSTANENLTSKVSLREILKHHCQQTYVMGNRKSDFKYYHMLPGYSKETTNFAR